MIIYTSPKSDNFPTKVFLFPRNHIYLTFSLSKMIYALLSKIVASRIYAILWAKSLRMPGLGGGGGVNLIQAMPEFWEHLVLAPLPKLIVITIDKLSKCF